MAIAFKDYYKVLGLTPRASQDEIRAAFRTLARQCHPDLAPGSEDRFKQIQEAYEVLGDPVRRRKYDYLARFERYSAFDGPRRQDDEEYDADEEDVEDWTELTKERFSDYFQQFFEDDDARNDEAPFEREIVVTLEEAALGAIRSLKLKRSDPCKPCFGVGRVNQQLCPHCKGHGRLEREETCRVKIPAGIRPGKTLRLAGMGQKVGLDGKANDLLLRVRFADHADFEFEGDDLYCTLNIAPWEAALGAQITVPTLTGRVNVPVPAGAQHGGKLRLKGRGLPRESGEAGDLVVQLRVAIPTELKPVERAVWEHLASVTSFKPREGSDEGQTAKQRS
ncbi:MAG TPA: J domain-containing protein [Methylomirabilota bacterium]|nr:J domain-containing protein [Methylomirabilota bacterium]